MGNEELLLAAAQDRAAGYATLHTCESIMATVLANDDPASKLERIYAKVEQFRADAHRFIAEARALTKATDTESDRCPVCGGRTFAAGPDGPSECSIECINKRRVTTDTDGGGVHA